LITHHREILKRRNGALVDARAASAIDGHSSMLRFECSPQPFRARRRFSWQQSFDCGSRLR
jgi:hypothetical protein